MEIILINKKQILINLKLIIIAIMVLFVINILIGIIFLDYSPAIGVAISKYKLDKYSKAVYGEDALAKGLPKHNIKDGEYNYTF